MHAATFLLPVFPVGDHGTPFIPGITAAGGPLLAGPHAITTIITSINSHRAPMH
ncbi:MAG: hypothetical protein RMI43_06570 [Candidatus Caldarchaeum sp.]|nr:hypothetical protein [Candidatus Caldarchaeum sp.]